MQYGATLFCNTVQFSVTVLIILIYYGPISPTPVNVNCRLKCFVTLVTYCCNNVFVYFNL
jgi:hypothetical protein